MDTIVGLFAEGEKPTGSRDPYGLRRAAHGVFKILVDLPELTGQRAMRPTVHPILQHAANELGKPLDGWPDEDFTNLHHFMTERLAFVLESRGFDIRNVRAVTSSRRLDEIRPADELHKLRVLPEFTETSDFQALANAFKRAKNLAIKELPGHVRHLPGYVDQPLVLTEPAEKALEEELEKRRPLIERAVNEGQGFRDAFAEAAKFKPAVDRFFNDVLVMAPDPRVRENRLRLLWKLTSLILKLADISEIVAEEAKSASIVSG